MSDTGLTPYEPVKPLVTPQQAKEQYQIYEQMKAALLSPSDYSKIQGKPFTNKSGWRKLGVVFNLSDEIVHEERTDRPDESFTWRIRVRVTAPNGRTCEGVASCDSRERKFAHVEHDVYAMAHTRAKNRAISDMIGGGAVSAEEMAAAAATPKPKPKPKPKQTPPRKNVDVKVKVVPKNQIAVTEDVVKATLAAHDLDHDDLLIYKYETNVRVQFKETATQDRFNELNDVLNGIMNATWDGAGMHWTLPATLPRNGRYENDAKKTSKT